MPSFDIVSEVDKTEVKNAIEQTNKEVGTRFDFKGSDARVEQAELKLTVWADNEFQLDQVQDIRVEVPGTLAFLLNYGNVLIETAGKSGQMIFYSIHDPRDAQEEIFRRMQVSRSRHTEREESLRSHAVVDELLAYDRLKQEQQAPTATAPGETPPNPNPGG